MSEPMTDADLAEMRARAEAATPGPWEKPLRGFFGSQIYSSSTQDDVIAEGVSIDDAAFIVHAREDVPRLLVEVERLRAENAAWREIGRAVAEEYDYSSHGGEDFCAFHADCGLRMVEVPDGRIAERWVHVPDCPVTRARTLFGETKASE